MSLINDALKKAQSLQARPAGTPPAFPRSNPPAVQATPTAVDPVTCPNGVPPISIAAAPARKGKSSPSGIVVGIASVVLFVGVAAIGYVVYALFFMASPADQIAQVEAKPAAPAVPPPAAPAPAEPAASAESAPAAATSDAEASSAAPAAVAVAPAAPPAAAESTGTPAAKDPNPATAEPTAVPAILEPEGAAADAIDDAAAEEEVFERVNRPNPVIQAWVDKITVTGIRGGEEPKALMNDRVYVPGDTVNHEFGLRLLSVDTRVLVFEDVEGNTYEYHF